MLLLYLSKNEWGWWLCDQPLGKCQYVAGRRHGQTITRTFDRLTTAKSWISKIEGDTERYLYIEGRGTEKATLLELLERYKSQISPSHKGKIASANE